MSTPRVTTETVESAIVLLDESCPGSRFDLAAFRGAVRAVAALEAIERRLRKIALYEANVQSLEMDEGHQPTPAEARMIGRRAALYAMAEGLIKPYGVRLDMGNDVRGSQIHLLCPQTGASNTLGGRDAGWAI